MLLANNDQVANHATSKACHPGHLTSLCTDALDGCGQSWSLANKIPLSCFRSMPMGLCSSLQCTVLLMDRQWVRQHATFCIGDVWVCGGTVNCQTHAIGGRTSVWVTYDQGGQLPEGVLSWGGRGIAAWWLDRTRQLQLHFVCVVERSGFSLMTEWMRGETCMLQQACMVYLAFPPPYTILLVQWKVNGHDLQPSLAIPSSCG